MQSGPRRAGSRCQCNSGHFRPCGQGPGLGLQSALAASSPMSWQLSAYTIYTPTGYVLSRLVLMEQSVPEKYSNKTTEPARPHQGTIYTCPMHPQIRRNAPGNCPICGMALEPVSAAAETGPSPELIDITRRFWVGTALAVPTVILEMGAHFPGLNLHPKTARRIRDDGNDEEVPLEQVHLGDRLRVRPGDSVPVDGMVIEGRSAVDESMVTGESMPVEKEAGTKVIGGTINGTGSLLMRAEKIGSDTMLARIVHMVAEAQRSRAPIQRLA